MYLTKSAYAAERLRRALASGKYAPGEHIQASRVANELGLSLTPVREAIMRLATEGSIVLVPHRGATVAKFSEKGLADVFEVRSHLESYATAKAATLLTPQRLDQVRYVHQRFKAAVEAGRIEDLPELNHEFHFGIYRASGSDILERLILYAWAAAPQGLGKVVF